MQLIGEEHGGHQFHNKIVSWFYNKYPSSYKNKAFGLYGIREYEFQEEFYVQVIKREIFMILPLQNLLNF